MYESFVSAVFYLYTWDTYPALLLLVYIEELYFGSLCYYAYSTPETEPAGAGNAVARRSPYPINVPRSRFLPVKATSDLQLIQVCMLCWIKLSMWCALYASKWKLLFLLCSLIYIPWLMASLHVIQPEQIHQIPQLNLVLSSRRSDSSIYIFIKKEVQTLTCEVQTRLGWSCFFTYWQVELPWSLQVHT
jgi:hypothetical protein